jgi:hypothetical protein
VDRQQFLKAFPGIARTQVIAAEFFLQLDIAMNEAPASLHMGFGWERLPALTRSLESREEFRGHASVS